MTVFGLHEAGGFCTKQARWLSVLHAAAYGGGARTQGGDVAS